jgi:hypothetical protein
MREEEDAGRGGNGDEGRAPSRPAKLAKRRTKMKGRHVGIQRE